MRRLLLLILIAGAAEAASTGITTLQTKTAAPTQTNLSITSPTEGTSLAHARADHVHGVTGTLAEANGGTGAGALNCPNQFVTSNGTLMSCLTPTLAGPQFANQGTTTTLLHGNAAGNPSWAAVALGTAEVSGTLPEARGGTNAGALTCTNQFTTSDGTSFSCVTDTLAGPQHANQGTTTTLLHGNAAGNPSWSAVALGTAEVSGTLPEARGGTNAGALTCTNQFTTSDGTSFSCVTDTLAGPQHANQGTTSSVLIGNAAGNPSWSTTIPAAAENVQHDATLTGAGSSGSNLGINLANANTWTVQQTFTSATANQTSGVFNGNGTGNGANFTGGASGTGGTGANAYGINVTGGSATGAGVPGPGINAAGGQGAAGGAPGLVVTAGASNGTNVAAAQAISVTGAAGTGNAAGTTGGTGGLLILGTAGVGGGTATGTGGIGGAAINVTAGAGGATTGIGTGGVGGAGVTVAAGAGGAAASTGVGGQGGLGGGYAGGVGGSAAGVGTGGSGGGGFTATAGNGGTATGAGAGGAGGVGGVVTGGNGGAVAGGTGGNGGTGFNAVGGNGASANGGGALGLQATGGNGTGTGVNGTGLIAQSGSGGTGTSTGLGIQVTQNNSIRAHENFNGLTAIPSSLGNGDVWYMSNASAATSWAAWRANSTTYLYAGNPFLSATTAAGQSINSATLTTIVYGTVETDTDSAYNSGTGTFTVPTNKGGIYSVDCVESWSAGITATDVEIDIVINGAAKQYSVTNANPTANESVEASGTFNVAAGQTIVCQAYQNSGSAKTLAAAAAANRISIKRLAD